MKTYKEYIKPIVVLSVLCLVVGAALALVNHITAPLIAANEEAETNATYFALLPDADAFTQIEYESEGVTAVLKADNGAGYIVTAKSKGYSGDVPAAVAFSNDGSIIKVIMMDNDETPGMGQKVTEDSFCGQFAGMAAEEFTIDDIDAVSGSTISSKAAVNAIDLAIRAYNDVIGGAAE